MNKILGILTAVLISLPATLAVDVGAGLELDMDTEDFAPLIWACGHRLVLEDNVEEWRWTEGGDVLWERINNYAFEGEQIQWLVLVMDKNGVEKIEDVYVTIGGDIEANCDRKTIHDSTIKDSCNARIGEEVLHDYDKNVMQYYMCTFTVETPASMYGEYDVTVEVIDLDGLSNTMDENEYWYFNPTIALAIDGDLDFGTVTPGTAAYSDTILVENDADAGSGVLLDMFISGTDFFDSGSSGAKCPTSNVLALTNFRYFATSGAYTTRFDLGCNRQGPDPEGYVGINYGDAFNPVTFYGANEVMCNPGNVLTPGAEHAVTFELRLPEPCNGDFDSGSIYFWGEAI